MFQEAPVVYDTAKRLADELRQSEEYTAYAKARERAEANESTRALLKQYERLQFRAQAAVVAGERDDETMQKLQKIVELLQFDEDASACLLAEYRFKTMLGDVYRILAEAVGVDLGALEA